MKRFIGPDPWFIVVITVIFFLFTGCEAIQNIPSVAPSEPGAQLVDAVGSATGEDVVEAVSIVAPAILGPWGLVLAAVARAWWTKQAAKNAVRSIQPVIDDLTSKERQELDQSSAAKRLIREARGKRLSLPI